MRFINKDEKCEYSDEERRNVKDGRKKVDEHPTTLIITPDYNQGCVTLGALLKLEKAGILKNIDEFVCTGIGGIIALLIVCGYDIQTIIKHTVNTNLYKDIYSFLNNPSDLSEAKSDNNFETSKDSNEMLETMIIETIGFVPTLEKLYMITGIHIKFVLFNLSTVRVEVIDYLSHPSLSCLNAVISSKSVPFTVSLNHVEINGNTYMDASLLEPCPYTYSSGQSIVITSELLSDNLSVSNQRSGKPLVGVVEMIIKVYIYLIGIYKSLVNSKPHYIINLGKISCVKKDEKIIYGYRKTSELIDNNRELRRIERFNSNRMSSLAKKESKDVNRTSKRQRNLYIPLDNQ